MAGRIFALIPAAGKSTRMGRPKLSLPLGDRTVLQCVITALMEAGVSEILVVIAPHVAELTPLAQAAGAHVLCLDHETPDMRTTVEHGLDWLAEHYRPTADDAWLLVPADHPTLEPEIVQALIDARRQNPQFSIFVPIHEGKRGHPTLIGWNHCENIRQIPTGHGLNTYFRQQSATTLELPAPSAEILRDLDTPEDYERLAGNLGGR